MKHPKIKPQKGGLAYSQLWRVVDGAVRDCANMHPDYFVHARLKTARNSIVKRVSGAVLGFAAAKGRSGASPAAGKAMGAAKTSVAANGGSSLPIVGAGGDASSPAPWTDAEALDLLWCIEAWRLSYRDTADLMARLGYPKRSRNALIGKVYRINQATDLSERAAA